MSDLVFSGLLSLNAANAFRNMVHYAEQGRALLNSHDESIGRSNIPYRTVAV
jgi:hypothetical protein